MAVFLPWVGGDGVQLQYDQVLQTPHRDGQEKVCAIVSLCEAMRERMLEVARAQDLAIENE